MQMNPFTCSIIHQIDDCPDFLVEERVMLAVAFCLLQQKMEMISSFDGALGGSFKWTFMPTFIG